MRLIIKHYWNIDIPFSEINNMYHGLIYFSLKSNNLNTNDFTKSDYSFKLPLFKILEKNKIYEIEFTSINKDIIEKIKNLEYNNFKVVEIIEDDNLILSNFISVDSYHSLLYKNICDKWFIDTLGKKNINYKKEHSLILLKELIEVQAFNIFSKHSELEIETNKKLDNGYEYYSFIKNIKITKEKFPRIKNFYVPTYDLLIEVDASRNTNRLLNILLQTGIGCKNGYGLGTIKSISREGY